MINTFPIPPSDATLVAREFREYDVSTLPTVPEGFYCGAWHNDAMPIWYEGDSGSEPTAGELRLAIDYPDQSLREFPELEHRYHLEIYRDDSDLDQLVSSNDWDDILTTVAFVRYVRDLGLGFHVDTRGRDYIRGDGSRWFSNEQAEAYDIVVDDMHEVADPYEVAIKVWRVLGLVEETPSFWCTGCGQTVLGTFEAHRDKCPGEAPEPR